MDAGSRSLEVEVSAKPGNLKNQPQEDKKTYWQNRIWAGRTQGIKVERSWAWKEEEAMGKNGELAKISSIPPN